MYTHITKKINKAKGKVIEFVHNNLSQIIIVVGVFAVLEVLKSFSYINLIPNYQFLTVGITLLLIVIFFKVFISNRNIILTILCLFVIAAITAIFGQKTVDDFIGFVIFILLLISLRQVIRERKELKKETSN